MSDIEMREEKKLFKAKTVSLIAKIIGGSVILVGAFLKWFDILKNCEIGDLCTVGFSIMGIFGTVDLNLLAEKFTFRR